LIKKILTITGASGVGKSTLEKRLLKHYGGGRVRTITTRPPRPGETDADYDFQTLESLAKRTDLLWNVPIHGHRYCVAMSEFDKASKETNGLVFVCITPERHEFLAERFEDAGVQCIPIHLVHPGDEELARRLKTRGEADDAIARRLADSVEFEKTATQVANLHRIPPVSPEEVFQIVLRLIEATP